MVAWPGTCWRRWFTGRSRRSTGVGGEDTSGFFTPLAGEHEVHRQVGGDLGGRMHDALATTLRRCHAALLVGSDCPFLTRDHLAEALTWLAQPDCDAVLGPATDGGYVLVGVKAASAALFAGVEWGGARAGANPHPVRAGSGGAGGSWQRSADIGRPADLALLAAVHGLWDQSA